MRKIFSGLALAGVVSASSLFMSGSALATITVVQTSGGKTQLQVQGNGGDDRVEAYTGTYQAPSAYWAQFGYPVRPQEGWWFVGTSSSAGIVGPTQIGYKIPGCLPAAGTFNGAAMNEREDIVCEPNSFENMYVSTGDGIDDVKLRLPLRADVRGGAAGDTLEFKGQSLGGQLRGGEGKDTLTGALGGVDQFFGGKGADTITAADGKAESIDCGPSLGDKVSSRDSTDVNMAGSCEVF